MKIIVSNFVRQYTRELLAPLHQKGWLAVFFTALVADKLPLHWLPNRWRQVLRKRAFSGIPNTQTTHFPLLFALERLGRGLSPAFSRALADWFDRRVASRLPHIPCDLVITYENANRATMRAAKVAGKITVLDLAQIHHDDIAMYARWFMSPKALRAEIEVVNPRKAEALRYTDYVLTLSTFAAESMLRHGWPAERLFTVNLGVDVQRFAPKKQYRADGPLRLLFVGTMTRRKGLGILFQALENLPEKAINLTLIGPVADAADLLRAHAGKFRHLPFLHHEELAEHYRQADVFVFPSLLDSWAQTVLEAMACGTPAIVTEHTGARDAVRQGGGWIIPAHDAQALSDQIQFCLNHRSDLEKLGKQAHLLARQYTWENYATNLTKILHTIGLREVEIKNL